MLYNLDLHLIYKKVYHFYSRYIFVKFSTSISIISKIRSVITSKISDLRDHIRISNFLDICFQQKSKMAAMDFFKHYKPQPIFQFFIQKKIKKTNCQRKNSFKTQQFKFVQIVYRFYRQKAQNLQLRNITHLFSGACGQRRQGQN